MAAQVFDCGVQVLDVDCQVLNMSSTQLGELEPVGAPGGEPTLRHPTPGSPQRRVAPRRCVRKSVAFGYYVTMWWTLPVASTELVRELPHYP